MAIQVPPVSQDTPARYHHRKEEGGNKEEVHHQGGEELVVGHGAGGQVQMADSRQGRQQQRHREGEEQRQIAGVAHHLGQPFGGGVFLDAQFPEGVHHFAGFGPPRAIDGAIAALMAQPDIRVLHHLFSPHWAWSIPLRGKGLLSGVGLQTTEQVSHW